ncbi:MAG: VanW family protein [Mycobacteriales bacterium]
MRGKIVVAVCATALATAVVGGGAVVLTRTAQALPGTTVAGAGVGGLDRADLRRAVAELGAQHTSGVLAVRADDVAGEIDRSLAVVDVDTTVDRALSAGRTGPLAAVLGPLLGALGGETGRAVELAVDVDQAALDARLDEFATTVDRLPDPGGFTVRGTTVAARMPQPGRTLDRVETDRSVAAALREGRAGPITVPVTEQDPPTGAADVERVVTRARRALGGPYSLTTGETSLRLLPGEVGPLLSAQLVSGTLSLQVDQPALNTLVTQKAKALDVPAVEAGFEIPAPPPVVDAKGDYSWTPQPAEVRVVPGSTGLAVDVAAATAMLSDLVLTGDRSLQAWLPLQTVEPQLTTAGAQAAGVRTLIGTFTTYFTAGQPRAANIRRIAELVDGAYVAPDAVFSLNDTAGRRTKARGFVADGAIVDGELIDEVGGGVSQFATTLFNAAFFAGLPILEHKPHSFFISRYPPGRESTVYFGALDVRFRNDTVNGISVQTSSTAGSVTVALYGDNGGRQVSASHGPREARTGGGFRIAVTRTVTGGDGVGGRRVFRTSYDPEPRH